MIYISTRYNYYTYANGVDSNCYGNPALCYYDEGTPTKGWIYNSNVKRTGEQFDTWLLSPYRSSTWVFMLSSYGNMEVFEEGVTGRFGIRPVVYLTSDVKITSGDGSSSNPYILSK